MKSTNILLKIKKEWTGLYYKNGGKVYTGDILFNSLENFTGMVVKVNNEHSGFEFVLKTSPEWCESLAEKKHLNKIDMDISKYKTIKGLLSDIYQINLNNPKLHKVGYIKYDENYGESI